MGPSNVVMCNINSLNSTQVYHVLLVDYVLVHVLMYPSNNVQLLQVGRLEHEISSERNLVKKLRSEKQELNEK